MTPLKVAGWSAAALCVWEVGWWARRRARRGAVYAAARERAALLGRPLVVIGAPDSGSTGGYGCGDITVDLAPSCCPHTVVADITKALPFPDGSVVVFCSCVLEYVCDAEAAVKEIARVSGGQAYFVGVEPWTLTAYLYPGRQRTLPAALR
jgi:SAM-dependent methyltransferase